jgi:uncharacterized protein with FMN-binding domain
MKKYLLSFSVILASVFYAFSQNPADTTITPAASPVTTTNPPTVTPSPSPTAVNKPEPTPTPPPTPTPVPSPEPAPTPALTPTSAPAPAPRQQGLYTDGTYIGSPADAYYGIVQVSVSVQDGKITAVNFLQYPNDRRTSQYINSQAMPILKSETIQAQSANVDIVSGATDTSMAFQQSLASALAQAKN